MVKSQFRFPKSENSNFYFSESENSISISPSDRDLNLSISPRVRKFELANYPRREYAKNKSYFYYKT